MYSELFVKKFHDEQHTTDMVKQVETLKQENLEYNQTITSFKSELATAKEDSVKLLNSVAELEEFKRREIEKLTCPHCQQVYETIYKLTSHKGMCSSNPHNLQKTSAFDEVPSNKIRMIR